MPHAEENQSIPPNSVKARQTVTTVFLVSLDNVYVNPLNWSVEASV